MKYFFYSVAWFLKLKRKETNKEWNKETKKRDTLGERELGWPAKEMRLKVTEQSLKSMKHCLVPFCLHLGLVTAGALVNPKVKKTHGKTKAGKCYFKPLKLWAFSLKTAEDTQADTIPMLLNANAFWLTVGWCSRKPTEVESPAYAWPLTTTHDLHRRLTSQSFH